MSSPESASKKRPKMATVCSDDNFKLSVPASTKNKLAPDTTSKFKSLVTKSFFVDKTPLISSIFSAAADGQDSVCDQTSSMIMMTGPRRFGKTVNLSCIADFVELEVDQNGEPLTKRNLDTDTVDDTPNYGFFSGKGLKIMEDKEVVHSHFGKYPLMKINFLRGSLIRNINDALSACRVVVHKSYLRHRYLYKSPVSKLEDDQKKMCQKWCDESEYENLSATRISEGLEELSEYLHKQFGRRVFIVIDEFDSIVSKAIRQEMVVELNDIVEMFITMIGNLLKDNLAVGGAFITGILDLSGIGISAQLSDLNRFRFSVTSELSDYYGFTEEEVKYLLERFKVKGHEVEQVHLMYNGYRSTGGKKLYNPFAVVRFLENKTIKKYWVDSTYVKAIDNAVRVEQVKHMFIGMLKDRTPLQCEIDSRITLADIIDLQRLHHDEKFLAEGERYCVAKVNLILNFMWSLGYLTHHDDGKSLIIPNNEIRESFKHLLIEHYSMKHGLDPIKLARCALLLRELFYISLRDSLSCSDPDPSLNEKFESNLRKLKIEFTCLLKTSNLHPYNESIFEFVATSIAIIVGFTCSTQNYTPNRKINDLMFYEGRWGAAVQNKYNRTAKEALVDLLEKEHYTVYDKETNLPVGVDVTSIALIGQNLSKDGEVSIWWLPTKRLEPLLEKNVNKSMAKRISELCKDQGKIKQCISKAFNA